MKLYTKLVPKWNQNRFLNPSKTNAKTRTGTNQENNEHSLLPLTKNHHTVIKKQGSAGSLRDHETH